VLTTWTGRPDKAQLYRLAWYVVCCDHGLGIGLFQA
jgi:hypothetical protein